MDKLVCPWMFNFELRMKIIKVILSFGFDIQYVIFDSGGYSRLV